MRWVLTQSNSGVHCVRGNVSFLDHTPNPNLVFELYQYSVGVFRLLP